MKIKRLLSIIVPIILALVVFIAYLVYAYSNIEEVKCVNKFKKNESTTTKESGAIVTRTVLVGTVIFETSGGGQVVVKFDPSDTHITFADFEDCEIGET